jgi:hypothetical protein
MIRHYENDVPRFESIKGLEWSCEYLKFFRLPCKNDCGTIEYDTFIVFENGSFIQNGNYSMCLSLCKQLGPLISEVEQSVMQKNLLNNCDGLALKLKGYNMDERRLIDELKK